jgi:hypothetical protein
MADELRRLEALQARLQLVGKGNDVVERQRFCSTFTHEAARLLHSEGWRRIRKTDGQNVDGMDIDKLVNATTFEMVDIIVSAGIAQAFVAWQNVGTFNDTSRFIEVAPIPVDNGGGGGGGGTTPPADDELLDAMRALVNGSDDRNLQLNRIADSLGAIAAVLMAVAKKLGLA